MAADRSLLVFTKPAVPGRVKTRLIGDLTAAEAAELHAAFLADLVERLAGGAFTLGIAWALADGETEPPAFAGLPAVVQHGRDLGERLYRALAEQGRRHRWVAAVGSDHPTLPRARVEEAFARLEAGADVVWGPATDGGYYLVAAAAERLVPELFGGIPWSTGEVLGETLERCRRLGLASELLEPASDVDTIEDLDRLAEHLAADEAGCPRTRRLLTRLGRLGAVTVAVVEGDR